jgi:hypothetical protein
MTDPDLAERFGLPALVGIREGTATLWIRRATVDVMDMLEVILGTPRAGIASAAEGGART